MSDSDGQQPGTAGGGADGVPGDDGQPRLEARFGFEAPSDGGTQAGYGAPPPYGAPPVHGAPPPYATGPAPQYPDPRWNPSPGQPYPGQGWNPQPPQPALPSGMAITSLVLGIAGLAFAWMPFIVAIGLLCAIAACVLGGVAYRGARRGTGGARGIALAGLLTGAGAVLLSALGILLSVLIVRDASSAPADPWDVVGEGQFDSDQWEDGTDDVEWDVDPGYPMSTWELRDLEKGVPHPFGQPVEFVGVSWVVTGVDLDADVDLSAYPSLFSDADAWTEHQVVIADLEIENTGDAPADPVVESRLVLVDGADRLYYDMCPTGWPGVETPLMSVGEMEPGARTQAQACFVVRSANLPGTHLMATSYLDRSVPAVLWPVD